MTGITEITKNDYGLQGMTTMTTDDWDDYG